MIMKRICTLLTVLMLLPWGAQAQKIWTLRDCILYAWENNLSVQQQEIATLQQQNTLFQTKMALTPTVSAQIQETVNWGRTVDLTTLEVVENKRTTQTQAALGASLLLFNGFQNIKNIRKQMATVAMAEQEVQKLKDDISIQITKAYLNVLLAYEVHETALQSRESVARQRENTQNLVDAGSQPFSALLEIESQLATENVQVVDAENSIRTNLLTLKQLLALPAEEEFNISIPATQEVQEFRAASVDELYYISQALPQIKKAEHALEISKHDLAISRGARYPRLNFAFSYSTSYSDAGGITSIVEKDKQPFFQQIKNNRNPYFGLQLNVPIFSQWQVNTNIKNASLSLRRAELEKQNAQQTLYNDIQQAANSALSTYQNYQAKGKNVTAMEESFRYVQQKFDVGLLNGTDYTVSKTNLFKAQSDLIQSKYQYIFTLKILDYYKGVPITL